MESAECIRADQILVYALPLDRGSPEAVRAFLSEDELSRADSYGRELDGRRFAVSRALLRGVVGLHTGTAPSRLVFRYGSLGRPVMDLEQAKGLDFSLARRDVCCVIALGRFRRVGIDLESRSSYKLVEPLMTLLRDEDRAAIEGTKGLNRERLLIEAWTALEAGAKAVGVGIDESTCHGRAMTYKNFEIGNELIGCVATEGHDWQMKLIMECDFGNEHIEPQGSFTFHTEFKALEPVEFVNYLRAGDDCAQ